MKENINSQNTPSQQAPEAKKEETAVTLFSGFAVDKSSMLARVLVAERDKRERAKLLKDGKPVLNKKGKERFIGARSVVTVSIAKLTSKDEDVVSIKSEFPEYKGIQAKAFRVTQQRELTHEYLAFLQKQVSNGELVLDVARHNELTGAHSPVFKRPAVAVMQPSKEQAIAVLSAELGVELNADTLRILKALAAKV